jgi:FKBP-type peptidyl-prolyl cis-trans isomerase
VKTPPEVAAMESVNRRLTEKDKDIIEAFLRRKRWNMKSSPDGYYMMILKEGTGAKVKEGSAVELLCDVRLLNGTICYTQQLRNFIVGQTTEITGLHKALLQMTQGTKARIIFPPHLAYGLLGDRNRIPARALLIFDVELVKTN